MTALNWYLYTWKKSIYYHFSKENREDTMDRSILMKAIKNVISKVAPEAEIILYGSQAREDAGPESDWDLLVLVDGPVDDNLTDAIRHRLYEIEWDTGEVISCIVRNRTQWHQSPYSTTPFYQTVSQEGIPL